MMVVALLILNLLYKDSSAQFQYEPQLPELIDVPSTSTFYGNIPPIPVTRPSFTLQTTSLPTNKFTFQSPRTSSIVSQKTVYPSLPSGSIKKEVTGAKKDTFALKAQHSKNNFPEVEYPTNVLDFMKPFYYQEYKPTYVEKASKTRPTTSTKSLSLYLNKRISDKDKFSKKKNYNRFAITNNGKLFKGNNRNKLFKIEYKPKSNTLLKKVKSKEQIVDEKELSIKENISKEQQFSSENHFSTKSKQFTETEIISKDEQDTELEQLNESELTKIEHSTPDKSIQNKNTTVRLIMNENSLIKETSIENTSTEEEELITEQKITIDEATKQKANIEENSQIIITKHTITKEPSIESATSSRKDKLITEKKIATEEASTEDLTKKYNKEDITTTSTKEGTTNEINTGDTTTKETTTEDIFPEDVPTPEKATTKVFTIEEDTGHIKTEYTNSDEALMNEINRGNITIKHITTDDIISEDIPTTKEATAKESTIEEDTEHIRTQYINSDETTTKDVNAGYNIKEQNTTQDIALKDIATTEESTIEEDKVEIKTEDTITKKATMKDINIGDIITEEITAENTTSENTLTTHTTTDDTMEHSSEKGLKLNDEINTQEEFAAEKALREDCIDNNPSIKDPHTTQNKFNIEEKLTNDQCLSDMETSIVQEFPIREESNILSMPTNATTQSHTYGKQNPAGDKEFYNAEGPLCRLDESLTAKQLSDAGTLSTSKENFILGESTAAEESCNVEGLSELVEPSTTNLKQDPFNSGEPIIGNDFYTENEQLVAEKSFTENVFSIKEKIPPEIKLVALNEEQLLKTIL